MRAILFCFNKSVILFQLRRYNETLETIKKINSNKEQELNLLFIKASCFGYLGDIETSKKIYQEIANIIPNNNDLLVPIGTTCLQQGIYEVARDIFQKIDKSSSYIFEKNYYMGLAYKGENRLEDAIKFFGNALRIKPDYFQLYPLTAAACFQSNMTEEGDKIMKMLKFKYCPSDAADEIKKILKPLFSNYIFVLIDNLQDDWSKINYTRGVKKIVDFDGSFSYVPDEIINELKSKEINGLISLSKMTILNLGTLCKINNKSFFNSVSKKLHINRLGLKT